MKYSKILASVCTAIVLVVPGSVFAVILDASSESGPQAGTSWNQSHTIGDAVNYLMVCIRVAGAHTVTGVTYNGDALTELERETSRNLWLFGIENADVGTHNITVNLSGNTIWAKSIGESFTETSGLDVTDQATFGSGTSHAITLTTTADNGFLASCYDISGAPGTAGTNTTLLTRPTDNYYEPDSYYFSGSVTTAGAYTQTVTSSNSASGIVALALLDEGGSEPPPEEPFATTTYATSTTVLYYDWLYMESLQLFFLALIGMGIIFTAFKQPGVVTGQRAAM